MIALERTVHQVVPHCPATPKPDLPTLLRVPHLHVQSINCPNAFESNKFKKKTSPYSFSKFSPTEPLLCAKSLLQLDATHCWMQHAINIEE